MKSWWEEAEARAARSKAPAAMAQALWQRLQGVAIDPEMAYLAAYDLAYLYDLCIDLVKLVDSALLTADGDRQSMRRHGLALSRWATYASHFTTVTAPSFNQLLDRLDLEPELLAGREEVLGEVADHLPEEEPKLQGRYQHWHLLYERLDLKLASVGIEERVHRALARSLSRVYEQCLITIRVISSLEKEGTPRFRQLARLLLEINTAWHFDLGPHHLGHGALRPGGGGALGLQSWLLLAFFA